jgi:N6-adenine-specific methylase
MNLRVSSGILRGRYIKVPDTDLRPTEEKVRSAFFNTLFSMIEFENRKFLDIFSGSGIFAFEAISRGFCKSCSIELNQKAASRIRTSAAELGIKDDVSVINADAFSLNFAAISEQFNTIFLDPPYALGDKMPDLLDKITDSGIVGEVCVIVVEGNSETAWQKAGWNSKIKKFGGTYLTIFYNWE